jgi:hypothetical protein
MGADANRVQLSVRLDAGDKEYFSAATELCGLEASVAARQLLELIVQRMKRGGDFIDAVHELKSVWKLSLVANDHARVPVETGQQARQRRRSL